MTESRAEKKLLIVAVQAMSTDTHSRQPIIYTCSPLICLV